LPTFIVDTSVVRRHYGHSTGGTGTRPPATRVRDMGVSPNPFAGRTYITFPAAREGPVRVEILDVTGTLVRHVWSGRTVPGPVSVSWDGTNDQGAAVASGIYMVRAAVDGQ